MSVINVHGSHGTITVHAASGHVLDCDECAFGDCRDVGYRNILWSDPARCVHDWPALLPAPKVTIIVHGWCWVEDGDVRWQSHCHDFPEREPDGWCVYVRREGPDAWNDPCDFHMPVDVDFETRDGAVAFAKQLAADYGTGWFED